MMTNIQCEEMKLSIPSVTANRLKAFTKARNGSIHNQAASALEAGIAALVEEAPSIFQDNYGKHFRELSEKETP